MELQKLAAMERKLLLLRGQTGTWSRSSLPLPMGLFNFLKLQKDATAECLNDPAFRSVAAGSALKKLPNVVASLITAGRTDEAKESIRFFLETYAKERRNERTSAIDLARISYYLAYHALPDLIYSRWDEFSHLWNSVVPFSMYLAIKGASDVCKWLSLEQITGFKCCQGVLKTDVDYYLIEFPAPPPQTGELNLDALVAQRAQGKKSSSDATPVLGPYFAVVLLNKKTNERQLYILGQSPGDGTTLRMVTAVGAEMRNARCGIGPEPTPSNFLQAVASHLLTL